MVKRILLASITAAILFIGGNVLQAQDMSTDDGNGQIRGVVTDAVNGETLIGVNVMVQGTNIGSATNVSGEYILRRVPAGQQTIVFSYIGYQRSEQVVTIESGETIELNFEMNQEAVEGSEVVVSAQARGQLSAINEQISSRTIKNVVSADKIRELPDDNAATALSRLPGVSLQDGDKVVIRGMQAKLNQVMVNGVQLPSTDQNDRSTNLGFISSNMLSGIEVSKSITSDMDANAIGGVVNLRLQNAPEGFRSDAMLQGTANTQDHTYGNYQAWASVSDRFFDNKIGVFLQGNARRFDGGGDIANTSWQRTDPGGDPGYGLGSYSMSQFDFRDDISITEEYGGSLIMDFDGQNSSLILQNTIAFTDSDNVRHFDQLQLGTGRRNFRNERDVNQKYLIINALQGNKDFDIFNVDFGLSHSYSQKETDLRYAIEFYGSDSFESITLTRRRVFTPDSVYAINFNEDHIQSLTAGNGTTQDDYFDERQIVGNIDFTIPFQLTGLINGNFKTGGKVTYRSRESDITRYFARLSEGSNNAEAAEFLNEIGVENTGAALRFEDFRDRDYGSERGSYFLDGNYTMNQVIRTDYMDRYFQLAPQGWGDPHVPDSRRFDYSANEVLSAGYVMADFDIGSRLSVTTGVRYEHFDMDYDGSYVVQTQFTGEGRTDLTNPDLDTLNTAKRRVEHLLPNLQLRYKFSDAIDLRLAYTQSLARPNYNQLMPSIFVNRDGRSGNAGNPNLKPTVAENYDAYFSVYTNKIGLFTIGGFYKDIEDVILSNPFLRRNLPEDAYWPGEEVGATNNVRDTDPVTIWMNNPEPAKVYGTEIEWQSNFWYLPRPFDSMVLNVNYTRSWSEMDYLQIFSRLEGLDPVTFEPIVTQVDTFRTARLLQQGNHTINVALGADYKGFSGRISYRMQANVITSVGDRPEEDTFTGNVHEWDFTIRQRLPVEGLSLFLNGMNIFHKPTNNYREFRRVPDGNSSLYRSSQSYYPRRFEIGLRFNM